MQRHRLWAEGLARQSQPFVVSSARRPPHCRRAGLVARGALPLPFSSRVHLVPGHFLSRKPTAWCPAIGLQARGHSSRPGMVDEVVIIGDTCRNAYRSLLRLAQYHFVCLPSVANGGLAIEVLQLIVWWSPDDVLSMSLRSS